VVAPCRTKSGFASQAPTPREPLILSGHGISLRIEGGALTIRNGFTHYPQKQET
jgi:CRISP-associated protein Cas1